MARGRKPLTAEQAAARGNPGRRKKTPAPQSVPASPDAQPATRPPSWLKSKSALAIWQAAVPFLESLKFIRPSDYAVLARYCTNLARWIDCDAELRKLKATHYKTSTNHGEMQRLHPAFISMMRLEEVLSKAEDRLGLNPPARQQLMQAMMANPTAFASTPPADVNANPAYAPTAPGVASQPAPIEPPASPLGLLANLHAPSDKRH